MMKSNKSVAAALAVAVLIAGLCGCQKQEGPVERAGKQVDKALDGSGTMNQYASCCVGRGRHANVSFWNTVIFPT